MAVTITSLIPDITYQSFLAQAETRPFKVRKTMIIATSSGQIEETATLTYKDANGKRRDHVIVPTIDPMQRQSDRIVDEFIYTFDGNTRLRFAQINSNATAIVRIYPDKTFNSVNLLNDKAIITTIEKDEPYVFKIVNDSSVAEANVDFGESFVNRTLLSTPDASYTVKGITKLSVAPVLATNPVAVGDNDRRLNGTWLTLTDGATVTWNYLNGYNAVVTIAGNRTLAITNAVDGDYGSLMVIQGTGGSRTLALPADSKVINNGVGVITLSTAVGSEDILSWVKKGSVFYFTFGLKYTSA